MLTKEEFKNFLQLAQDIDKQVDKLHNDYRIEYYETPLGELVSKLISQFIQTHFDSEGEDLVNWWLYEIPSTKRVLYPQEGGEISVETPEQLYEEIKVNLLTDKKK